MTDILEQITQLAVTQLALQAQLAATEDLVKQIKERLRQVQEVDLPMAMAEAGISAFTLEDGSSITIRDEVTASIPAKSKGEAYAWLDAHGFGDLIKTQVAAQFGRGELEEAREIAGFLVSQGVAAEVNQTIHPQTLKAWVREQLAEGRDIPLDLFGVFQSTKAIIKEGK